MKVYLLKEWIGKPPGAEIELEDAKAKRLIATGLVAKVKAKDKAIKPKERKDERTEETTKL